ncbi:hypothetical protein GCM10025771_01380 [Niveibacterium umoris]|uniref:CheY-like chemotaxis protein n=1 Tax=Niveibacterium umoris TaxID=1193620 RepID=A0A840BSD0_9RHOO|nr:response regulator [Niveibacterium umoris]MBB4014319.1 CheY-like chemotaxis protein [Niveibacterium umoris]
MTATPSVSSALVVDDSVVQRSFAAALCREFGITQVLEAADGAQALERLAESSRLPTVAIIDLEMPGMDGVELLQQMHQRDFCLPIVIASARDPVLIDSVVSLVRALGLPFVGALQKPIKQDALFALLASLAG